MRCEIKALTATLLFAALTAAQSAQAVECPSYASSTTGVIDGAAPNSAPGDRCARNDRTPGNSSTWGFRVQIPSHVSVIAFDPEAKSWMSMLAGVGLVFLMVGRHKRRMF
jgi:hypothetical protein